MTGSKTYKLTMCAFFAALTAVLSQIALPIGPVPINLATFAVFCAGAMLGAKLGAVSMLVWTLLGVAGAPVFTLFRGGIGVLVGPTGGYILGYTFAAYVIGLIIEKLPALNKRLVYPMAMLAGMAVYFVLGTAWYSFSAGVGFGQAFMVCVFPFIPGDLFKIAGASLLARRFRPYIHNLAKSY